MDYAFIAVLRVFWGSVSEAPSENLRREPKTETRHSIVNRVRVLVPALILVAFLTILQAADLPIGGWIPIATASVLATLFYLERSMRGLAERPDDSFGAVTTRLDALTQVLPGASFHLPVGEPTGHHFVSEGGEDIYEIPGDAFRCLGDLDGRISSVDRGTTQALRNEALAHGEAWELTYRVTAGEDQTRWVWECGRPYRGSDGNDYAIGILLDVTPWHRMEQRFETLLTAVEHIAHELYVVDTETLEYLYVNRATLENLQYSREEIRDLTPVDLGCYSEEELARALQPLVAGEISELRLDDTLTRKDGSTYPIALTISAVPFDRREAFLAIGADITEELAQQERLRRSEERYELALMGSNDGVWDWDAATGHFNLSLRGERTPWYETEGEEVTFETFIARIHPDDQSKMLKALDIYHEHRDQFSVEFRFRGVGDQYRWMHTSGQAVWDENGQPLRMAGCFSDVTSRKESDALLQDTVSRLGAVLWNVADGIITFDGDGKICSFNPAAEGIFECSEHAVIGLPISELIPVPGEREAPQDWITAWDSENDGRRRGGARFPLEVALSTMTVSGERMYTAVLRDISDRKKVEQALVEAKDKAEAAARTRTEFLATMSHEIRTPMNGVLGMTQLLLDMKLEPEQRDIAEMIYSSGESLLSIINDVLDFSKIEAGKLTLEAIPFDLRTTIGDVTGLMAGKALEKGLELLVDYPADVPYRLIGDVGRIRQVLVNLVGNAVKFTHEGHVVTRVVLKDLERERARLQVIVEDSGMGIEPAERERLFAAFTQADASTTRRFGGTGLGLAICRQLTSLMGGEIGVESEPGEGSRFWFTIELPLDQSHLADETPERLRGMHALVVDDNPMGRRIFHHMLRELEMTVVSVASGEEALEALTDAVAGGRPFDLALLDYHMPGMDGETLVVRVRELDTLPELRLVTLTSSGQIGERDRLFGLGVDGYLMKPVLFQSLTRELLRIYGSPRTATRPMVEPSPNSQLDGPRVLLAEDNIVNQKVAVKMLETLGCRVDVAPSGAEALEMWSQHPYELVFMDVHMPGMDGIETTGRMREIESGSGRSRTPIIAMTANAMEGDAERCFAAGMDDYAAKPVKKEILRSILAKWKERIIDDQAS